MSDRPRVRRPFSGCKSPAYMAAKCTTDKQRLARLRKLEQMIKVNEAEIRHAQQRIEIHLAEQAMLRLDMQTKTAE